ncbi:DciA family protein [Dechloromonas sp. ZY10]|uniref:DciA family protein n=1 Tax=Dechloromonas aquae TaxID=2664436 RepID=UPI003529B2BE
MIQNPEHFLERDGGSAQVLAHARLLHKLARRFEAVAPLAFRQAARVANFRLGVVVILAENGAVAAKIRQMSQRLCDELSRGGTQCSGIEVKVQPRQSPFQSRSSLPKGLSGAACDRVGALAAGLPPGPLREALARLAQRRQGGS